MAFSKGWGYGGCVVLNLFAMRATQPSALVSAVDFGMGQGVTVPRTLGSKAYAGLLG